MCRSCDDGGRRCSDHTALKKVDLEALRPGAMSAEIPEVEWGTVPTAAELYDKYDADVAAATIEALQRVSAHEPAITEAVFAAVPEGCRTDGLAFRMKSPASLARKIAKKAELRPDLSAHDVSMRLTDFVRYTVVADKPDRLASCATETMDQLRAKGWIEIEAEHMYVDGNPYKGLHVIARHEASGQDVEIQFHTEQEIAIKNKFHEQYEIERNNDVPRSERAEAHEVMVVAWQDVEEPPGVVDLPIGDVVVVAKVYPNRYKRG
ncbi:hypothetical protein [Microbacterium paraoxydans]|uniref:hypothetical protein n=1 Tax=Microbacterium paraoxydans TaxID=199592 RepID=UPI0013B46DF1|nr:hypothetical protein [Microbacterium paraoxydans]